MRAYEESADYGYTVPRLEELLKIVDGVYGVELDRSGYDEGMSGDEVLERIMGDLKELGKAGEECGITYIYHFRPRRCEA